MEDRELVDKLLHGSENIDRMREEIEQVVGTILGLIAKHGLVKGKGKNSRDFECADCSRWNVCWDDLGIFTLGYHMSITDLVIYEARYDTAIRKLYGGPLYFQFIQTTHANLSVFVGGMAGTFSGLVLVWQPFLDAADYFPPQQR